MWWRIRHIEIKASIANISITYTPFLIFDQIERLFYNNIKDVAIESFFKLIKELSIDYIPERFLHSNIEPKLSSFKILFALRDDYLGQFDYWSNIKTNIPSLTENRFCLRPLNYDNAKAIISLNHIEEIEAISEQIIKWSTERDHISSILLSVYCSSLYNNIASNRTIEVQELSSISKKIIIDFYDTQIIKTEIPLDIISKIEDILIDTTGNRHLVSIHDNRFAEISFTMLQKQNLIDNGIIRRELINKEEYIEIIHDKVADAIFIRREERRKRMLTKDRRENNVLKFKASQNVLSTKGRSLWDNNGCSFSISNTKSLNIKASSDTHDSVLNKIQLQELNKGEDLFIADILNQTTGGNTLIFSFKPSKTKDGIDNIKITTYEIQNHRCISKIEFLSVDDNGFERPFYNEFGFHGISIDYDEVGNEIKRQYLTSELHPTLIGINKIRYKYSEYNLPIEITYLDANDQLCKHIDGNSKISIFYDENGNETRRFFKDEYDNIIKIYNDIEGVASEYDENDRLISRYFINRDGRRVFDRYGYHGVKYTYTSFNKILKSSLIDLNGQMYSCPEGYSQIQYDYDKNKRILNLTYLDCEGNIVIRKDDEFLYSQLKVTSYDEFDRITSIQLLLPNNKETYSIIYEYDSHCRLSSTSFKSIINGNYNPANGIYKSELEYYESGYPKTISYFNSLNQRTIDKDGISIIYFEYNSRGKRSKYTTFVLLDLKIPFQIQEICYKTDSLAEVHVSSPLNRQQTPDNYTVEINSKEEITTYFFDEKNEVVPGKRIAMRENTDSSGITKQLYFDENNSTPICTELGIYGRTIQTVSEHHSIEKCLGIDGDVENNIYGYSIVETSSIDSEETKCFYDKNHKRVSNEANYHKEILYQEGDIQRWSYYDINNNPCSISSGYHQKVVNYVKDKNLVSIELYDVNGCLTNCSEGWAKIIVKKKGSNHLGTYFSYPFKEHCLIRHYNSNDEKIEIKYEIKEKCFQAYKMLVSIDNPKCFPTELSHIYKLTNKNSEITYRANKLYINAWRCPFLILIGLIYIFYYYIIKKPFEFIFSIIQAAIRKTKQRCFKSMEVSSIIIVNRITEEYNEGDTTKITPAKNFGIKPGFWILKWNNWNLSVDDNCVNKFEEEFNATQNSRMIKFYDPKTKSIMDIEFNVGTILGLNITDSKELKEKVKKVLYKSQENTNP